MVKKSIEARKKEFRQEMVRIAQALGVSADEIGRSQFLEESGWKRSDVDAIGQFSSLKKLYFPKMDVSEVKHGAQLVNSFRNKLEKREGMINYVVEEMGKVLEDRLNKHKFKFHKKVAIVKKKKAKHPRVLVVHWSDSHFGANIKRSEVQVNEYNWTIASRRLALFVEQVCQYKQQYRKDTELIFCLNGDIIAGVIHDQEWFSDLLVHQYVGSIHILGQALTYLAQNFKKVTVYCSPGNHGRAMHKSGKDRATTNKYDSYETFIYVALKMILQPYVNIEVVVPKTPYAIIKTMGHNFFMSHGDTVINVGNPGNSLNMRSINNQINKLNASELGGKVAFDVLLVGHVHTPTAQLTESGCMLLVNGCSSGLDPFAQSIGIFSSNPTQLIFESTPQHPVGDMRFIQLKSGDNRKELDKIVEPYDPEKDEF